MGKGRGSYHGARDGRKGLVTGLASIHKRGGG